MATRRTLIDDVLATLGQPNDGASNPAMETMIIRALDSAQVQLAIQFPWVALKARKTLAWPAGTWYQDLPTGLDPASILAVTWLDANGLKADLDPGIEAEDENRWSGIPMSWSATSKQRILAAEAETGVNVLALSPTPSEVGTVQIDYRRSVSAMDEDADVPLLHPELLVLHVATFLSPAVNPGMTQALSAQYKDFKQALVGRQSSGRGWTFSRNG
jgi:hypothetical protein